MLTPENVKNLLVEHHIITADTNLEVEQLSGGVSCVVFKATVTTNKKATVTTNNVSSSAPSPAYVIKQARPQLQTQQTWLADVGRYRTEVDAASLLASLLPGSVPEVLAVDDERHAFVMQSVANQGTWKDELLNKKVDLEIAKQAGKMLGEIHEISRNEMSPDWKKKFASKRFFYQLRIEPYFRTIAKLHSGIAKPIEQLIQDMLTDESCLVHADFSPKNMLITTKRELVLIDHEVAHMGNPTFDLAFCLALLAAKSIHMPTVRGELCEAMRVFSVRYSETGNFTAQSLERIPMMLAAMMLARVDGKSPAEYLTATERATMSEIAYRLVAFPADDIFDHIRLLEKIN